MNKSGIQMAVESAGGRPKLAEALKVSEVAVHHWIKRGWVTPARSLEIEALFGIPCSQTMDPQLVQMANGKG